MKKLYPKDLRELVKIEKAFSSKPAAEQEQHQHNWEQVVIGAQPGFGVFNDRTVECCFACGKIAGNKRLITLISTKGKTSEEVAREASQNFQKYERVKAQVIFQGKNPNNNPKK